MNASRTEGPATAGLSVVVPVHDEAGNVAPLVAEIRAALEGRVPYEIVYVDDGSADGTAAELALLTSPGLRVVRHRRRCGQSAAIRTGVRVARHPWVATLDGDGQNDPADLPKLLAALEAQDRDDLLVAGRRTRRRDTLSRRLQSRVANVVRGTLLRDRTQDTGCGLKLFPRALFLDLPAFDHMHRFLPALFIAAGARVVSVDVSHRPRVRGSTKYGLFDRLWIGLVDLFGVRWLQRRVMRPETDEEG